MRQAQAELFAIVDRIIDRCEVTGWEQHVIGEVFREIEADRENLNTYSKVVGGAPFSFGNWEKATINRRIGARVKRRLGAEVEKSPDGKPLKQRCTGRVILSYTLLKR